MANLKELLEKMESGEISTIEYGMAGDPLGFFSTHRIEYRKVLGGNSFYVSRVISNMVGSSYEIGASIDSVLRESDVLIEDLKNKVRSPQHQRLYDRMIKKYGNQELVYFIIQ